MSETMAALEEQHAEFDVCKISYRKICTITIYPEYL